MQQVSEDLITGGKSSRGQNDQVWGECKDGKLTTWQNVP